jgi:uncharacterized protein YggE
MRHFLLFLFGLILSGCLPAPQGPVGANGNADMATLVVRGDAKVLVKPDQVEMTLEAVTSAADAETALRENSRAIDSLTQLLQAEGLQAQDYRTGQFSIQPQWSRPPQPAPANWVTEIVAYRVSNNLLISTRHTELTGKLLALAQQAGVNKAGNLNFSLADPETASLKAIAAATARAHQRALTLAEAAGVKLGRVVEARVESTDNFPQPRMLMAQVAGAREAVNAVPIVAGEVEVSAAVMLSYQLVP